MKWLENTWEKSSLFISSTISAMDLSHAESFSTVSWGELVDSSEGDRTCFGAWNVFPHC